MFCEKCQQFWQAVAVNSDIPEIIQSKNDVPWARYDTVLHNSIRELKQSSSAGCVICRAIEYTPNIHERAHLLSNYDESLDIVLSIEYDVGQQPMLCTGFWEADQAGKVARIPKRLIAISKGIIEDEDLAGVLDRTSELENTSTGSDATFELVTFWLNRCLTQHKACREISPVGSISFVPTRLIDVADGAVKLVETKRIIGDGSAPSYVTLSHCWGQTQIIRTLKENYDTHLEEIDASKLSKTFREATHATRKLGHRYIWIDSLCIIQDDGADWEKEAATMCDVYRNAVLKIGAAHATGGEIGCFTNRDGLLHFPFIVDIQPTGTKSKSLKPHRFQFDSYGREEGIGGPEPALYGRAWVLQEQLLSPRMLIYDGSQVRWECASGHGSERSPMSGMSRHIGHQRALKSGIFQPEEFFSLARIDDPKQAIRYQLQYWCYGVMDYTHRGMTKAFDRLVAIHGIVQALKRHTSSEYHAGLWNQYPWIGLLWNIPHVDEYTPTTVGAFDMERNKFVRHEEDISPSWSWASVTVPVCYSITVMIDSKRICDILDMTSSGTASKQRGTLKIRGETRTGFIDAIYPYSIREAVKVAPEMQTRIPTSEKHFITYRGRSFHPNDFFIFSPSKPSTTLGRASPSWRLIRGSFRPDEIIRPSTQLTFIAIAQHNTGRRPGTIIGTHDETDPLVVWSLALVPTGRVEGEYRRVGYAVWEDCYWYGYACGMRERPGCTIEKADGWRGMAVVGDLENLGWSRIVNGEGKHEHRFHDGELPGLERYHGDVGAEERVVVVV
ncbi:unnamed protein product [Periconia digitata]|uniref:Heterokaryon incompatibility domain-containing protein n=1 Tax=Periconia digitata TaxID=1303443 RepID=A0A9W4UGX5_9PLEO|nr:unnamed protein product [Periconia digitata]